MLWLAWIPVAAFFTFKDLYESGFPAIANEPRNFLEWCFLVIVGCVFTAILSLPAVGLAAWIGGSWNRYGTKDKTYPLVALRERDGVSGQFYFLGAGEFQDRQYYFWYRKDGDHISGGKTSRVSGVRIYEDDSDPRMITFRTEYRNPLVSQYGWIIGIDLREDDWYPDFHIPPGSIKEGYSL